MANPEYGLQKTQQQVLSCVVDAFVFDDPRPLGHWYGGELFNATAIVATRSIARRVQAVPWRQGLTTLRSSRLNPLNYLGRTRAGRGFGTWIADWFGRRPVAAGLAAVVTDEEVINAVRTVPEHYASSGRAIKGKSAQPLLFPELEETPLAPRTGETPKSRQRSGNRREYMGQNPNKQSTTYRKVVERMREEGKIVGEGADAKVQTSDGDWIPLNQAELSHTEDAMGYWNREGRF
jgi:hypothetical protein